MKKFLTSVFGVCIAMALMATTTVNKPTHLTINALAPLCSAGSVSSGSITLSATSPRVSGISPLTVWMDASASTDTSSLTNETAFEDDQFTISYGDTSSVSGSGNTWAFGSNPGLNSRNVTTGAVGAHMYYISPGTGDQTYSATITQNNGSNTAACRISVTVNDPWGANGYSKVVCVGNTQPTVGTGGCPASIANGTVTTVAATTVSAVLAQLTSGTEVLMHCGDTFTGGGDNGFNSIAKGHLGAFGGCENTKTNRPIFSYTAAAGGGMIMLPAFNNTTMGDFRFTDFECQSPVLWASQGCINFSSGNGVIPYQITMYNLNTSRSGANYYWSHGAQMALVDSSAQNQNDNIGTFVNVDGNGTGKWSGTPISNINYQAVLGNFLAGTGDTNTGNGTETIRISACMFCIFANNEIKDASTQGAVFKLFESNDINDNGGSQANFGGIPVQYVVISDNYMHGKSGAQLMEITQQNTCNDERFYDVVDERNLYSEEYDNLGSFILISGQRISVRDNVFYTGSGFVHPSFYNLQLATRANSDSQSQAGCPQAPPTTGFQPTMYLEVFNNTSYAQSFHSPQVFIEIGNAGLGGAPASNSYFSNNLYFSAAGSITVDNNGTGNTIGNNTSNANVTNNPAVTNGTGAFSKITDFQPTANYTGGASVPVWKDAIGTAWPPTWDLGAVHH